MSFNFPIPQLRCLDQEISAEQRTQYLYPLVSCKIYLLRKEIKEKRVQVHALLSNIHRLSNIFFFCSRAGPASNVLANKTKNRKEKKNRALKETNGAKRGKYEIVTFYLIAFMTGKEYKIRKMDAESG